MIENIKRHGKIILLGNGLTATESRDGNLPSLTIRENGKVKYRYRGSSLHFNDRLTTEDKEYLLSLAN